MIRFFRQNVTRKIAFVMGASCLAVTLLGLIWMIELFRTDVLEYTRQSLENVVRVMETGFSSIDQETQTHPIPRILSEMSSHEGIDAIQVFDRNGKIIWSQQVDEPGRNISPELLAEFRSGHGMYHESDSPLKLASLRQLRAQSNCVSCHSEHASMPGSLLGGIYIEASYSRLNEKMINYGIWQIISSLLLVIFVTVMIILIVRGFIGHPLTQLNRAIEIAKTGNYMVRVQIDSDDEIGKLGKQFNEMLVNLNEFQASKLNIDVELTLAQKELQFQAELQKKNRIIEETNRKLTHRLDELALLFDLNQALTSTLDLDQVLNLVSEMIGQTLGFEEFTIALLDERRERLEIRLAFGLPTESSAAGTIIEPRQGRFTEAVRTGRAVLIDDLSTVTREGNDATLLSATGSFLGLPIRYKDRILGLLAFGRPEKDAFSPDDTKLLTSVTQQAAMAILNAQLYQEKLDLSITDELTKLANRRHLQTRLELEWNRAHRFGSPLSLLMIDIDEFKRYNDVNGHLLGDQVLEGVAQVLKANTRKVDTVARFGGEEFVVILPEQNKETSSGVAEKLRKAVARTRFTRMQSQATGHISVSIGVATYPDDGEDPKLVLDRSDLALYVAKCNGRNRVVTYQQDMEDMDSERRKSMTERMQRRRHRPSERA
jgi:diguanylate cyclase (GGDEF)-like protein